MTARAKWPVRKPEMREPGFGRIRWTLLLFIFLPIPVLLLLGPYLRSTLNGTSEDVACLVEPADIAGHAVYLLDLRKPLSPAYGSLPGKLLRDVSHDIEANTELKVYALTRYAESPRMLLGRLCKPYDNADLKIATAKDQGNGNGSRDCDDVPAQVLRIVARQGEPVLRPARYAAAPDRCARPTGSKREGGQYLSGRGHGRHLPRS